MSPVRDEVALNEAAERMTAMAELARRYPQARIVFSGGSGRLIFDGVSEASLAARLFESFGIAKERITLEDKSRDTLENARFTKELVQPKPGERWLLVTSAHHMPRSVGLFRAEGFAVEAYPVDYRTRGAIDLLRFFSTVGDGLRRTDTATREWVGLLVYRITGRTAELFPGPAVHGGSDRASGAGRDLAMTQSCRGAVSRYTPLKSRGSTGLPLRRITTRPCSASATATRRIGCISGPH